MLNLEKAKPVKISFNPKSELFHASLLVDEGDKGTVSLEVDVPEKPSAPVISAMEDLRQDVITLCELKGAVEEEELEVRNVSLDQKKGVMGVTIHAVRTLKNSSSPLNLHTPHKVVESEGDGEGDPKRHLSDDQVTRVRTLIRETMTYLELNGNGPQIDAFADTPEAQPESANGKSRRRAPAAMLTPRDAKLEDWINERHPSFHESERGKLRSVLAECDSFTTYQAAATKFGFTARSDDYQALVWIIGDTAATEAPATEEVEAGELVTV